MKRTLLTTTCGIALAAASASAQTATPLTRTGVTTGSVPAAGQSVLSQTDVQNGLGTKADYNPLAAHLAAGQTVAQLTSGAIDAAPAIIAAVAAGVPLRLPCGTYRLDEPVTFGASATVIIDGATPRCVTLNANFAAGDIFLFSGTYNTRIDNLTVGSLVQRTAGSVFHLAGTYRYRSDNVTISGPQALDGWLLDGANTTNITNFDCRNPVPFVTGTFGAGACLHGTNNFADVHIAHGSTASWHYGMELTYGSGWYADDVDCIVSGNGVIFDPSFSLGQSVYSAGFTDVQVDTSYGDNFLGAGDGWVTDVEVIHLWASNSQAGNGIAITNTRADGVQLVAPTSLTNHAAGLVALGGTNITVTGIHSMMNSQAGSGLWDDIYIGNSVGVIGVYGGRTGLGGTGRALAFGNFSRYGLNAQGGGPGQTVTVMGLTGTNHVTGFMNVAAVTSPSVLVNLGNVGN